MGEYIPASSEGLRLRRVPVDRVVIHATEGSIGGTIAWFQMGCRARAVATLKARGVLYPTEAQVLVRQAQEVPTAAHYVIGMDGRTVQMVLESHRALHAGRWNERSIGVELEAHTATGVFPTAMLEAAAVVVAESCRRHGIPVDREHIVGHSEVPGATHTDPGPGFPWGEFLAMVRAA